ncbi:MAG: DNA polymerase I, partial [Nitrospirota bacterium]
IMGLMGDSIDNIPGVPGIGEKTAIGLISEFGTIEYILANIDRINKPKLKETLKENSELARLSRQLATIRTDLPMEFGPDDFRLKEPDRTLLLPLYSELEFNALTQSLLEKGDTSSRRYRIVTGEELNELTKRIALAERIGIYPLIGSRDETGEDLLGMGISPDKDEAYYVPIYDGRAAEQIRNIFEDGRTEKFFHDLKKVVVVLKRYGLEPKGRLFDIMIASYLLNPNKKGHGLDEIVLEWLSGRLTTYKDLSISGPKQMKDLPAELAASFACEMADMIHKSGMVLGPQLKESSLEKLFRDLEIPLLFVLAEMEETGFKVDKVCLEGLSSELEVMISDSVDRVYKLAGVPFNINSPKQLAEVLFDRLGLKPVKKTKTGYSTDEGVLTQLALIHELPGEILNYRQNAKLKSTFVDPIIRLIHPGTGRIHTSLNQTATATGRLSSSEPNLQNIPARGEMAKRIRRAFVADEGYSLLGADYSQIELRVLAHLSGDERLTDAFMNDKDIHLLTAVEIFGLPPELITPEMRRRAKTVNFGIIYGMSPYGLSADLGISQKDAKDYIESYFSHYPGVKVFINGIIKKTREIGYVTTILNRRRYIPEINAGDVSTRELGERFAVNTPIQGTASDIIKMAMINIHRKFMDEKLVSRMLLQIHDELIFEVNHEEMHLVNDIVKEGMESVVRLNVPLKVDLREGGNWEEVS